MPELVYPLWDVGRWLIVGDYDTAAKVAFVVVAAFVALSSLGCIRVLWRHHSRLWERQNGLSGRSFWYAPNLQPVLVTTWRDREHWTKFLFWVWVGIGLTGSRMMARDSSGSAAAQQGPGESPGPSPIFPMPPLIAVPPMQTPAQSPGRTWLESASRCCGTGL